MLTFFALVAVYVVGGLTFVPLLVLALLAHAYVTLPVRDDDARRPTARPAPVVHPASLDPGPPGPPGQPDPPGQPNHGSSQHDKDRLPASLLHLVRPPGPGAHVPDVAAGYFAVCRDYVPGGVKGRPPERTTPTGQVVLATESPSVYQSMYRTIFDRNRAQGPSLDGSAPAGAGSGARAKRARNVFYVVLRCAHGVAVHGRPSTDAATRHGHLMLYDDADQLEVRHVISLAHYDVDIYGGGDRLAEGELWIKRNCIRLVQRPTALDHRSAEAKPFFLFSDNCSDKEDFYHAMLQNQDHAPGAPGPPLRFNTTDLVKLVQQLHASEDNLQTRWFNALVGRLFLGLYKTAEVEAAVRTKIANKIARVPKPALISSIQLQSVHMGHQPPFITNPKLKELTVDGDLTLEADVRYLGDFRLEISAIARIELGTRFKAREVSLVLAGILKKLEGHVLVRIKPPPSNRLWLSFETAPKMELLLEPVVSYRQITYGVILRAIESRIREVVAETLVLPHWDDMPFSETTGKRFRGGIWADEEKSASVGRPADVVEQALQQAAEKATDDGDADADASEDAMAGLEDAIDDKSRSASVLRESAHTPSPSLRRSGTASGATASSDEPSDGVSTAVSSSIDIRPAAEKRPKAMRSTGTVGTAATPIVNMNAASVPVASPPPPGAAAKGKKKRKTGSTSSGGTGHMDAAEAMRTISRSQPTSPTESPAGSLPEDSKTMERELAAGPLPSRDGMQESAKAFSSLGATPSVSSTAVDTTSTATTPRPSSQASFSSEPPRRQSKRTASLSSLPAPPQSATATGFGSLGPAERRQGFNQSLNTATAAAKKWFAVRQGQGQLATARHESKSTEQLTRLPVPEDAQSARTGSVSSTSRSSTPLPEASISMSTASVPSEHTPATPPTPPQMAASDSPAVNPLRLTQAGTPPLAPLGSPGHPIGRGHPLPPPGTPLPRPAKLEKRRGGGWAAVGAGAAALGKLARRRGGGGTTASAVSLGHGPAASSSASLSSLSAPLHPSAAVGAPPPSPGPDPGTAAPDASAEPASPPPPLPPRRKRLSVARAAPDESLVVVEAPSGETEGETEGDGDGDGGERGGEMAPTERRDAAHDGAELDEGVFAAMDDVEA